MTLDELNAIVDGIAKPFKEQLSAANERIALLEIRINQIPDPVPGKDGVDGRDGIPGRDGKDGVDGRNGLDGQEGPPGKDGAPGAAGPEGLQGKDGASGRDGIDGKDGRDGAPGADGIPGKEGAAGRDGRDGIDGKDGRNGADGIQGKDGTAGPRGADGPPGRDGKDVDAVMVDAALARHVDEWALDFERRAQELFLRVIEKMPKPKDGRDAFELEDLSVEHDGDGILTLIFKRGEFEKRFEVRLPRTRYVGVFREGNPYRAGDHVSAGGSEWAALTDNPVGRPGSGDGWQLAVKRGKDGRDGVMKPPVDPVPVKL